MDEIILIDKPSDMSSFGVVARVRRKLTDEATAKWNTENPNNQLKRKKVKVGHTGTLDPFATGLLILLSGKATKKSNDFLKLDKSYEAEMILGQSSTTGDPEGELSPEIELTKETAENISAGWKIPAKEQIEEVFEQFTGEISQVVPAFSAVKINGQRAYKLAREGKEIEMPERKITIYKLELLDYDFPSVKYRAHVSSGTYIRTLSEDLGKALGTVAYTKNLRRLTIGEYSIENAAKLDDWISKE